MAKCKALTGSAVKGLSDGLMYLTTHLVVLHGIKVFN